jgi:hypothetical protein
MSLIDFVLNLAGLLMWLSWRGLGTTATVGTAGTLLGNLRPADVARPRRWRYLAALLALLLVRALLYRQFGPAVGWHGLWSGGVVAIAFRSDGFLRMLAFSGLSFLWTLFVWQTWLIGITAFNRPPHDKDAFSRQAAHLLGWLARLPAGLLVLVPVVELAVGWLALGGAAAAAGLVPPPRDFGHLAQQAVVIGLGAPLTWRGLLYALYALHLLNTYVYLGRHPFWEFVQHTGQRLGRPFAWARIGSADFAPVLGGAAVWLLGALLLGGLPGLPRELAANVPWLGRGILPTLYQLLPLG